MPPVVMTENCCTPKSLVEDDVMHAVGAVFRVRCNAVENDVAHADLALKGLVAGLGVDAEGAPAVEILSVIGFVRGLERGRVLAAVRLTDRVCASHAYWHWKRCGERAHRERAAALSCVCRPSGIQEESVVYGHIFLTGDSRQPSGRPPLR